MRRKCLAQGHYCRCQQIRTGDLTIESPWSYPLSHNSSSNTGTIPTLWKLALVSPIHKSGDKGDPSNYRPISLTCIACKIMEHTVLSHVSKQLASNKILTDAQHGFRQGLSTTTLLSSAVHDWSFILQNRTQVDTIFLDFQKAFDRVPHQ